MPAAIATLERRPCESVFAEVSVHLAFVLLVKVSSEFGQLLQKDLLAAGHRPAVFPQDAVIIKGETRDYTGRHFCPRCGSSVFARTADEIEVHLGSLDAPDQLMPTYESWTVRREAWLPPFSLARRYERNRDASGRFED